MEIATFSAMKKGENTITWASCNYVNLPIEKPHLVRIVSKKSPFKSNIQCEPSQYRLKLNATSGANRPKEVPGLNTTFGAIVVALLL